jgi:hypothetical protein
MKRLFACAAVALLVFLSTGWTVYRMKSRQNPAEWLGKRFELSGHALEAFLAAHERYTSACGETCRRIVEADAALALAMLKAERITPEIEDAIQASAQLDAQCRVNMLRHFYEAASNIPDERREEYLRLVMPLVLRGAMNMDLPQP